MSAIPSSAITALPICIIGAGGIVNTAHLPAYAIAGFNVHGICDLDASKAIDTAKKFNIPNVYSSITDMLQHAPDKVVFDIAIPGPAMIAVLEQLPEGAFVLLQKPMGDDLEAAKKIVAITRSI